MLDIFPPLAWWIGLIVCLFVVSACSGPREPMRIVSVDTGCESADQMEKDPHTSVWV